jgi:ketosteroid isomerase-like protein
MTKTEQSIWDAIRASNAAWFGGEPEGVADLFHEDVVMASPDGTPVSEGKEAMVRSFVEYCRSVVTHEFKERDPKISLFGGTAVATFDFDVRYEHEGKVHDESGREILVFTRQGDAWQAVWRMQIPR